MEKLVLQFRDGRANITIFVLPFVTDSNSSPIQVILVISKLSILEGNWISPTLVPSNLLSSLRVWTDTREYTFNRSRSSIGTDSRSTFGRGGVDDLRSVGSRRNVGIVRFHDVWT
jgi:hypothetical protein